jgi:DNA modification methylase
LYQGDCIEVMRGMPEGFVQTCVTSPPYYGLRDYGVEGQIGLEESPDEYVQRLVEVFRGVRRVLRDDGTVWLNLGDSYWGSGGANNNSGITGRRPAGEKDERDGPVAYRQRWRSNGVLKPKDLIGIPWRVAFALQADGWWLRQDIIWNKPNPMPESVRDRCTKAHEYIFLLSKSARYYYDADAIAEQATTTDPRATTFRRSSGKMVSLGIPGQAHPNHRTNRDDTEPRPTRNRRSVWTVTTKPYKGAHFATFPPDLIAPCILAGSPIGGVVLDPFCGSGTTLEVAEKLGRKGVGIELNPDYCELIRERMKFVQPNLLGAIENGRVAHENHP